MTDNNSASPARLDLTTCDREPIHIPGAIQPHGFLVALDARTWRVRYVSENAGEFLPVSAAPGRAADEILEGDVLAALREVSRNVLFNQRALFVAYVQDREGQCAPFTLLAHQIGNCIILEGEKIQGEIPAPRPGVHHEMDTLLAGMEAASNLNAMLQLAAEETRRITGFDRVMVYQFDPEWNGIVVAEDRNTNLPSYLHLRFPASDIPKQARELYRVNRLRMIARADYKPVRLLGGPGETQPLDLSLATLRSVSPVHLEYMRNMGTASSMSISLMRGQELWGLVSCHSRKPGVVPFEVRATCELLSQVLSLQIAAREQSAGLAYRMQLEGVLPRLISGMAHRQDVIAGLRGQSEDLLGLTQAAGAAVLFHGRLERFGKTPTESEIKALAEWLEEHATGEVTAFDRLTEMYPPAEAYRDVASGILAISISRVHGNRVIWFRPEVTTTVKWGGNPTKPVESGGKDPGRLHPRKSFETWTELVRGRSVPWQPAELAVARALRGQIIVTILQHAEQLAALSTELVSANKELETISYTISHDLRAPLRAMYGYADSLREDAADRLEPDELQRLERISRSAHRLDRMIQDVLSYGHVSRIELQIEPINLDSIVHKLLAGLMKPGQAADVEIVGTLPTVEGQVELLEPCVSALLSNAVKFVTPDKVPMVRIWSEQRAGRARLYVEDNGIGIEPEHQAHIFELFQHVHPESKFEGNGVGLAIAKRAINRLQGEIGVQSTPGQGSRFWIELPKA